MSNQSASLPAKSMVGPLEELYLVSFIADGPEQTKIESALRAWTDKWLCLLQHDEVIDNASVSSMQPEELKKFNTNLVMSAKQRMGEALSMACGMYKEGPLNDLKSIHTGLIPTTSYRQYSMIAIKRWER